MSDLLATGPSGRLRARLEAVLPAALAAEITGAGHLAAVFRGAASVLLIRVLGAALIYASMILLARWMGAFEFGIYAYVWTWVVLFGTVAPLGLNTSILRFVPEYFAKARWGRLRGVVWRSHQIVALSAVGSALLCGLALWLLSPLIDGYYIVPLIIGVATIPLFALMDMQEGTARSFGWVGVAYATTYVSRPALLIAFAGLLVILGFQLDGTLGVAAMAAACLVAITVQGVIIAVRLVRSIPPAKMRFHTGYWLQISLPMLVFEAAYLVMSSTDVMMLGQFETPDEVAIYFAAARTAGLVGFIYFATAARGVPKFSEINASGSREDLQTFLDGLNRLNFWPTLAGSIGLIAIGPFVLSFFGEGFEAGYPVLAVLIVMFLARTMFGPLEYLLSMTGRQMTATKIITAAALINIVLNAVLIPALGTLGAALATLISMGGNFAALGIAVHRTTGVAPFLFRPRRKAAGA